MKKSNVKSLCVAMAAAMTVGSMTPAFSADAASKAKFDKTYKKVRQDVGTYNYNLKGLKKNYKVKWTIEDGNKNVITDGVSLENQGKKVTAGGTSLSNKLTIEDISSLDAGLKAKTKYYVVARVYVKNTKTKKYEFSYKVRDRIYFFADAEDVTLSVKENTISSDTVETKVGSMLDFDAAQKPKNATTTVYYSAKNASGQAIELKKGVTGTALTYAGSGKVTFNEAGEFEITVETKRSKTSKVTATKTVKVIVKEDKTEEPTPEVTEGAKQTGVQTITLTTKENINAASAASIISVKKGSSTVNLDSSNPFVINGNTVYIKTASRMTAGDYTVTVNGKKYTFKAEDEKVDKIEILNDKLVVSKPIENNKYTKGTVGYHVLNQFAEDMTRRAQVTANSNNFQINSSTGTVTYDQGSNSEIRIGDKIALTLINTTTGKSDSKILTVSAEANVAEIEVADIQGNKTYVYNKDKKTLTEDTDLNSDKFYILFTAKDQYENVLNPSDRDAREKTVSEGILFSIPGLTNLGIKPISTTDNNAEVTQIEVNGKNYFAVQLTKKDKDKSLTAGTDNTLMICKGSGKNVTTPITVNAGSKVATISVSAPDVVIAGQPATFEFTALDANGNDVSNKLAGYYTRITKDKEDKDIYTGAQATKVAGKDNNNAMNTIPDNFVFEKNYDTNKVELKYYSERSETDRPQYVTFVTATNQVVSVQFTVKASSKPTTITKIAADKLAIVNLKDKELDINLEDIKIEDQYGKEMSNDEIKKNTKYGYSVKLVSGDDIFSLKTPTEKAIKIENRNVNVIKAIVKDANDSNDKTKGKEGSARIEITLTGEDNKEISGSMYTFTIQSVNYKTAFKSYSVDDIGVLFDKDSSRYSKEKVKDEKILKRELGVYGVMSDGTKVRLPGSLYNAQNTRTNYENDKNGYIKVINKPNYPDNNNNYKTSISIVIGHSGDTINKELTISKADPTINKLEAKDGSITKLDLSKINNNSELIKAILEKFKAFNQYNGEELGEKAVSGQAFVIDKDGLDISKPASITISDKSEDCDFTITGNGTDNLSINGNVKGEFTVTVKAGSATAKSKFVILNGKTITSTGTPSTPDTPDDNPTGSAITVKTLSDLEKAIKYGKTEITFIPTSDEEAKIPESINGKNVILTVNNDVTYTNEAAFKKIIITNQADKTWIERYGNDIQLLTGGTIRFNVKALDRSKLEINQKGGNDILIETEEDDVSSIKKLIVNIEKALKPVTVKVPSQLKVETAEDIIDIKADTELTLKENAKANIKVSGSEDGEKINLTVASNSAFSKNAPITVTGKNTTVTLDAPAEIIATVPTTVKVSDISSNSSIKLVDGSTIKSDNMDLAKEVASKVEIINEDGSTATGGSINAGDNNTTVPLKQVNVESIIYKGTTIISGSSVTATTYAAMKNASLNEFEFKLSDTIAKAKAITFSDGNGKATATVTLEGDSVKNKEAKLTFKVEENEGSGEEDSSKPEAPAIKVEKLVFNNNINVASNGVISLATYNAIKGLHTAQINGTSAAAVIVSSISDQGSATIKYTSNDDSSIEGTMKVNVFAVEKIEVASGTSAKLTIEGLTSGAVKVKLGDKELQKNVSFSAVTSSGITITITSSALGEGVTSGSINASPSSINFIPSGKNINTSYNKNVSFDNDKTMIYTLTINSEQFGSEKTSTEIIIKFTDDIISNN